MAENGVSIHEKWRESFGGVRVPRGVYRFKTHEEADQWFASRGEDPPNV
jgi:hypothetical protein